MLRNFLFSFLFVAAIASFASAQATATSAPKDTNATAQAKADSTNKGGALYFDKEQVEKIFAAGGSFVKDDDKNYQITAGSRTTPGTAEIHGNYTDIFYVLGGSATIVTGGSIVDEKTVAPEEFRGTAVKEGETRQLSKGDLIVIPHGTPHWLQQVQGTFQYLVVKVHK